MEWNVSNNPYEAVISTSALVEEPSRRTNWTKVPPTYTVPLRDYLDMIFRNFLEVNPAGG